jgi:hypothetical protein
MNLPASPKGLPPRRKGAETSLGQVVQLARAGEAAGLEFSAAVAHALSLLPPGGRHALAVTLFEAGLTERLDGAVAETWARLFAECASAGEFPEPRPDMRSAASEAAQDAVRAAGASGGEERWLANVLSNLIEKRTLPAGRPNGATAVREAWKATRKELWEADIAVAPRRAA